MRSSPLARLPIAYRSSFFLELISQPLLLLLLAYFVTAPIDALFLKLVIFKVKINNLLSIGLLTASLALFKRIYIEKKLFRSFLLIFASMLLSCIYSENPFACFGFLAFFIFNYFSYIILPDQLFRFLNPAAILRIYSLGFWCTGIYASCQVLFSLFGLTLSGVTQWVSSIARGQGFAYEPAFYALYMTPFAMFHLARYILSPREERKKAPVLWSTIFLLASTSTSCFFIYLSLLFFLTLFRIVGITKKIKITKFLITSALSISITTFSIWFFNEELIKKGFLKVFYSGIIGHSSFYLRWEGILHYWQMFLENPLVGVGLGGGTTYYIKHMSGKDLDLFDPEILSTCEGAPMNVATEVLGSLGIAGALAFIYFFSSVKSRLKKAMQSRALSEEERINLISFALSLSVLLFALQFNQSIMRAYVWLHVGIAMGYANYLIARDAKRTSSDSLAVEPGAPVQGEQCKRDHNTKGLGDHRSSDMPRR